MNPKYKKMFEPIQIGHMLVKNRIEMAPAAPRLASAEGLVTPELIEWTRVLAKGGAGIVTTGFSSVTPPEGHLAGNCSSTFQFGLKLKKHSIPTNPDSVFVQALK